MGMVVREGRKLLTIYDLRRTAISDWMASGASPKVIMRLGGHANLETTMKHYAKADAADLRAAVNRRRDVTGRSDPCDNLATNGPVSEKNRFFRCAGQDSNLRPSD